MLDPIKYPQYYVERPDQLSEKFKHQYDIDKGNIIFLVFFVIVIVTAFLIG